MWQRFLLTALCFFFAAVSDLTFKVCNFRRLASVNGFENHCVLSMRGKKSYSIMHFMVERFIQLAGLLLPCRFHCDGDNSYWCPEMGISTYRSNGTLRGVWIVKSTALQHCKNLEIRRQFSAHLCKLMCCSRSWKFLNYVSPILACPGQGPSMGHMTWHQATLQRLEPVGQDRDWALAYHG